MSRTLVVAVLLFSFASTGLSLLHDHLYRRQYINSTQLLPSYDYVIAGGGLAGLVVASRLAEDSNVSVLVVEAGASGDEVKDRIDSPAGAYYSSLLNTNYDWNYTTVAQSRLFNRSVAQPRGRVLGGSTALNAMYVVRPSKIEVDAWADLLSKNGIDANAANRWNWENLYKYMKKAENFTAPTSNALSVMNFKYDASTHGANGPLQISYPGMMVNVTSPWTSSCASIGVSELSSPNGGVTLGSFITPSTMNPSNFTRSYSRSAYIDPLPPNSNFHILTEHTVLRIDWGNETVSGNLVAKNVVIGRSRDAGPTTVPVKKEVILAAGVMASPKILMMSGVGPRDVLESVGVKVMAELPGVGQRLQDHLSAGVVYESKVPTAGDIHDSNSDLSKTKEFLSVINNAVAFANASAVFGGNPGDFTEGVMNSTDDSVNNLVPSKYDEVKNGHRKIYEMISGWLSNSDIAQAELVMSVISPKIVVMQANIQHPYSVGRVYINSSDPWDRIVIDPGYFSHWADAVMLRQSIRLTRLLGQAFNSTGTLGAELTPGANVQNDSAVDTWLANDPTGANSQFHSAGTCSMLPKSLGGVVDADLKVYGSSNVRVVDGSIFPFEFAAHLASVGYGVAEQAAVLITASRQTSTGSSNTLVSLGLGIKNPYLFVALNILFSLFFWT